MYGLYGALQGQCRVVGIHTFGARVWGFELGSCINGFGVYMYCGAIVRLKLTVTASYGIHKNCTPKTHAHYYTGGNHEIIKGSMFWIVDWLRGQYPA